MTAEPRWLLIRANEDGDPCSFLTGADLPDLAAAYGIRRWLTGLPVDDHDTNYWPDGTGLLLRIDPTPTTPEREMTR